MHHLTISAGRLARLRAICLGLSGASERETWGDPTWRIGERIFAMQKGNHDGGRPSVWFKASEGGQQVLVGGNPDQFFVPPYLGGRGWVGAHLDLETIDWDLLASLIGESYRLIAPARRGGRAMRI